jgi:hypothetical protein
VTARRNPYFILGLDYGTTERDLINRGLSRASRRVRAQPSAPFDITDCTWAADELIRGATDPAADVRTFRVPADPAVFERTADVPVPPPRNLARTTGPSDEALTRLRAEILADICGTGLDEALSAWFDDVGLPPQEPSG